MPQLIPKPRENEMSDQLVEDDKSENPQIP